MSEFERRSGGPSLGTHALAGLSCWSPVCAKLTDLLDLKLADWPLCGDIVAPRNREKVLAMDARSASYRMLRLTSPVAPATFFISLVTRENKTLKTSAFGVFCFATLARRMFVATLRSPNPRRPKTPQTWGSRILDAPKCPTWAAPPDPAPVGHFFALEWRVPGSEPSANGPLSSSRRIFVGQCHKKT